MRSSSIHGEMHSMFLVFVWRRKILILFVSLVFLIGVWAWAIYYTTSHVASGSNSVFINDGSNKIMTVHEFDGARDRIIAKYGVPYNQKPDGVRFVQPTDANVRAGDSSMRLRDRFQSFSSFFLNKDAEKMLQNLDQPSRDEIGRRKSAEVLSAAEKQGKYERELHRMVS